MTVLQDCRGLRLKSLLLLFIFALNLSAVSVAAASPMADNLAKDFVETKKEIEAADIRQRQILSALYQVNKKIKKTVTEKSVYSQQRAFLEVNIRTLSQTIVQIDQRAKSQRALLAERLRAIYKLGGPTLARFLFSSQNSGALEKNLKIMGIIAARDLELIKNYRNDSLELERKKSALAQRLASLKTVEIRIAKQEQQYRKDQEIKGKILDKIRKSKLFALNKIQSLREKSLQINIDDTGLFDILFKPSFADHKGVLPTPLDGVITKKFGLVKGDDHPYSLSQKGVFISAARGAPIKSIFEGRVSYVGDLPGFGKTLIIDHGDHYYSVYSHTQDVKVQVGDEVSQSHLIARVGDQPQSENSGIYFEIRHFSEPYDPQQWMKGL